MKDRREPEVVFPSLNSSLKQMLKFSRGFDLKEIQTIVVAGDVRKVVTLMVRERGAGREKSQLFIEIQHLEDRYQFGWTPSQDRIRAYYCILPHLA